ncbi:MAG: hypothetical protein GEV07_21640 [Streptosporangiales bacterium]|nr:hypothetical protein [Streptosporangiales bacterium]
MAGRLDLRADLAEKAIADRLAKPLGLATDDAAAGVLTVVDASMDGAIRVALRERGDDPRDFALAAFGGAGALHARELAHSLGIRTVVVPPHPGTLCALGLLSGGRRLRTLVRHAVPRPDIRGARPLSQRRTRCGRSRTGGSRVPTRAGPRTLRRSASVRARHRLDRRPRLRARSPTHRLRASGSSRPAAELRNHHDRRRIAPQATRRRCHRRRRHALSVIGELPTIASAQCRQQ